jgi:hypothetical protein
VRDKSGNPFLCSDSGIKKIATYSPTLAVTPKLFNYIKYANAIPITIIETLAILNLCPSLLSKMMVDEIWNNIPITTAVISS